MTRASTDVLIDRIPVGRNLATDAVWVIAFSLVTAVLAQISFHLPFIRLCPSPAKPLPCF